MPRTSLLGDLLTTLIERRARARAAPGESDIISMCHALMSEQGEMRGMQLAADILSAYGDLDREDKNAFFWFLNDELDLDPADVTTLSSRFMSNPSPANYQRLVAAAEPPRQELLRRLNQAPGATARLVAMRTDLRRAQKTYPDLARTDHDFVHLLKSWFNRGFLVLKRIDWNTSANILEKIIAYEAVHAIDDWDDLRRRLHPPDRRCFAFFHPAMPDEPLVFVEVALTAAIPGSIQTLLAEDRADLPADQMTTAVFYSISNCQHGLSGISFGHSLIKQVVAELSAELEQLRQFVTLSPVPGLNRWLAERDDVELTTENLRQVVAKYLTGAKTESGDPYDPVARFHLGNGATLFDIHADADLSENGFKQSNGAMVNYLYDPTTTEDNHEAFVTAKTIVTSKAVRDLAAGKAT